MKGSELLVKCLENEGVQRVFGIPGEENLDLIDSFLGSGIDFVLTRHESSATFVAGMVGRLTGRPGVCLSTLGPGASNMVIGVGEAYLGYHPLVAMSGQVRTECQQPPRKQYLDLVSMFRPITKASLTLPSADRVPDLTRKAFGLAAQERPGPVFLELPEDIMKERCEGKPLPIPPSATLGLDRPAIAKVRDLITAAKQPLVLAGYGVVRAHAADALTRFAEAWNVPVAMTWQGAGAVAFDHPLSLGTVGLRRADAARSAFESSDLIILVGFDLMEFEAQYWNIGARKDVVYLGSVPCSSSPGLRPVQVLGDIPSTLKALGDGASAKASWTSDLKTQLMTSLDTVPDEAKGIKPQAIVRAIRDALGRGDIAVSDVGAHLIWMAQRYPVYKENTLLMSNGLIPMGVGVPWAIAAKMTFPERKVVASVGDGSFLMTGMELLTAKELGTPMTVVVWNDSEYRLIRAKQEAGFKRTNGVKFLNPNYESLASSMGFTGHKVGTATELRETLAETVKDDGYALIEVMVDSVEPLRFG